MLPAILRLFQEKSGIDSKRLAALNSVRNMTDHVRKAVDHGHDFANRLDWVKEMQKLGDIYRDLIPDLYTPIQMISWRIRDHSFDHNQEDSSQYCCDELIMDLRALQFEVLKLTQQSMAKGDLEAMAVGNSARYRTNEQGRSWLWTDNASKTSWRSTECGGVPTIPKEVREEPSGSSTAG